MQKKQSVFDKTEILRDFIFFPPSDTHISIFKERLFSIRFLEIEDPFKFQIYLEYEIDSLFKMNIKDLFEKRILINTSFSIQTGFIVSQTLRFPTSKSATTLFIPFILSDNWKKVEPNSDLIVSTRKFIDNATTISISEFSNPFDQGVSWVHIDYNRPAFILDDFE